MIGFNGGVVGKTNATNAAGSIPGVWTSREQEVAVRAGRWPGNELLDIYTGSTAAFSLRPIRAAYSASNLVEVRRSNDNQVNNFTGAQINNTGTGGMLAWVKEISATASGFVSKWYDQSGSGNHAVQGDAALQPRIVNAGSLELDAGKPAIVFGLASGVCLSPPSIIIGATAAFFAVTRHISAASTFSFYLGDNGTGSFFIGKANGNSLAAYTDNFSGISGTDITQKAVTYWQLGTSISQYKINSTGATLPNFLSSANWRIGTRFSSTGQTWIGPMQEVIYYPASQVSTHANIMTNINAYYSIY